MLALLGHHIRAGDEQQAKHMEMSHIYKTATVPAAHSW